MLLIRVRNIKLIPPSIDLPIHGTEWRYHVKNQRSVKRHNSVENDVGTAGRSGSVVVGLLCGRTEFHSFPGESLDRGRRSMGLALMDYVITNPVLPEDV